MQGIVKWFDEKKGYGFIKSDGRKDLFVHHSGIAGKGFKKLTEGQSVTFDTVTEDRGEKAVNVVAV